MQKKDKRVAARGFALMVEAGLLTTLVLLAGCGKSVSSGENGEKQDYGMTQENSDVPDSSNENVDQNPDKAVESSESLENIEEPEMEPVDDFFILPDVYFAYTDYLRTQVNEDWKDLKFSLIYLDGDAIPELVYSNGIYRSATVTLCKYKDGEVVNLGTYGENGSFGYLEGEGVVYSNYNNMGIEMTSIYCLEQYEMKLQKEFVTDYNSQEPIFKIDDEVVTQETYENEKAGNLKENALVCGYDRFVLVQACDDPALVMSKMERNEQHMISAEAYQDMYDTMMGEWQATNVAIYDGSNMENHDTDTEDTYSSGMTVNYPGYASYWLSMGNDFYQDYAMAMLFHEAGPGTEITNGQCNFELFGFAENTQYYAMQPDGQHLALYIVKEEEYGARIIRVTYERAEEQ